MMTASSMLPCAALFLLVAPALTQGVDLKQVQADLDHVFERPPGRVDRSVVQERFAAFWKKYDGKDLRRLSYARGLSHYWHGDFDQAVAAFDSYLDRYGPDGITNREQRMTVGRAYLSTAVKMSRAAKIDEARFVAAARNFARCYEDLRGVIGLVTRALGDEQAGLKAKARVAMASAVLARKLPVAEQDAILAAIYADAPAPRAGRGAVAAPRPARPTTIAPFTATAMSGREIDLKAYRGQVVLVDFWATWCGPCLREMPNVVAAYRKFHGQGFEVIGISLDKPGAEAAIRAKAGQLGMQWEQVYDGGYWDARLAKANGIRSIPAAFLIDRAGKVRFAGRDTRGENLQKNIAILLAEKVR